MNSIVAIAAGCLLLFTIIGDKMTTADNEFKLVPKLYEEIGCKEINKSGNSGGLTSYECPDFETYASDKCYLNGKTFNVGDDVEGDVVPSCRAACKCIKRDDKTARIECADVECPEHFSRNWSCVSQYDDVKQCCRTGEVCDEAKIRSMNQCDVEGKTYRVGERIYPDNSCYECLCTLDYNNKTTYAENTNCVKINCGIELKLVDLKAGCVPVYFKKPDCCPIEYKCPSKDDAIESHSEANESQTCKFGELTLKRGDSLKSEDKCMKCECAIPPYLTCIKSC